MNGLDTIIRDNLKWTARAYVAVAQRGLRDPRISGLHAATLSATSDAAAALAYDLAWDERDSTRGL